MYLALQQLGRTWGDYNFLQEDYGAPGTYTGIRARMHGVWTQTANANINYCARPNSLHPRALQLPASSTSADAEMHLGSILCPLRLYASLGNYTANATQLNIYKEISPETYQLVASQTLSPNTTILLNIDDIAPAFKIALPNNSTAERNLDQLLAYNIFDISPYLDDLGAFNTEYEASTLPPLGPHDTGITHYARQKSIRLRLTLSRDDPNAQALAAILHAARHGARLLLAAPINNITYYLPVYLAALRSAPSGTLITYELDLIARETFAYTPERQIATTTTNRIGINNPSDAPTPCELRLSITAATTPIVNGIIAWFQPWNKAVQLRPDQAGIWSLYDDGNLYRFPQGANANKTKSTQLATGNIPPLLMPGQNTIVLDYSPAEYTIEAVAIAYYPRVTELLYL